MKTIATSQEKSLISTLSSKGYRITPMRRRIIDILLHHTTPLSAPDIKTQLEQKMSSDSYPIHKSTIYREIATLVKERVAQEVTFTEGTARYEIARDHHHHLICMGCGAIADVTLHNNLSRMTSQIKQKTNFAVKNHSFEFYGLCQKCQHV